MCSSVVAVALCETVAFNKLSNFHKSSNFFSCKITPGSRINLFFDKFSVLSSLQKRIISGSVVSLLFFTDSSSRCFSLPTEGGRVVISVESKIKLFKFVRYQNYGKKLSRFKCQTHTQVKLPAKGFLLQLVCYCSGPIFAKCRIGEHCLAFA